MGTLMGRDVMTQAASIPDNEADRIEKLDLYRILDTPPEEAFDRITRTIAEIIDVPIALVSLVDRDRQWFKSRFGLDAEETPRDLAFCSHAILGNDLFVVEDTTQDPRFSSNPLVVSEPSIRFYAGAPLKTPDGYNLGTLCAIDRRPRSLTDAQRRLLSDFAHIVVDELELRVALKNSMKLVAGEIRQRALKNDFIATVSHELRTPLTSIKGSLGLLRGGAVKNIPDDAADLIGLADRNVNNLMTLIDDLLDFQQMDSGNLELEFEVINAETLVRQTCENIEGYALERKIKIRIENNFTQPLHGDPARLAQVFSNLISNAIKFSPEGGEVVVATDLRDEKLYLSVEDQGSGVPENFQRQVFDKFAQADGVNKRKGTGLGLAISKSIVEAHRGEIGFKSDVGKGATFFVMLPLHHTTVAI